MEQIESEKLNTTGFVSKQASYKVGSPSTALVPRGAYRAAKAGKKPRISFNAAYFLVRLGICALIFGGIAVIRIRGDADKLAGLFGTESESGVSQSERERLGRLRFVELPSIIEVFAPSKEAVLPANANGFELISDNTDLILSVRSGAPVDSPTAGTVKDVGEDASLGRYVRVAADNDMEFEVYGLSEISVERGQPVKQGQRLGLSESEKLTVRAYKSGRPLDLSKVFGLGKAG